MMVVIDTVFIYLRGCLKMTSHPKRDDVANFRVFKEGDGQLYMTSFLNDPKSQ